MSSPEPLVRMRQFLALATAVTAEQWERMAKARATDADYGAEEEVALAPERRVGNSAAVNAGVNAAIGDFMASDAFTGSTIEDVLWRGGCVGVLESAGVGITGVGKRTPEDIEVFLRPFVQIAHLDLSSILPDDVWQVVKAGPPMTTGNP